MTIGLWVIVVAVVVVMVMFGFRRLIRMAGCAAVVILGCFVAVVMMHVLAR